MHKRMKKTTSREPQRDRSKTASVQTTSVVECAPKAQTVGEPVGPFNGTVILPWGEKISLK